MPLIAVAVMVAIIAILVAQRDYQLHGLVEKVSARPATTNTNTTETKDEQENDDFFS